MSKTIYQIYDKIFKKILTLSSTAVVNLINGLFGTNYPTDSIIHYNWAEFESTELKRILADTILTINNQYSYHMEAQITEDDDIIGSIESNLKLGNITMDDARRLRRLTHRLYEHIYSHYEEMEELNEMTDESLMLDIDLIEKEHEQELAKVIAERDNILAENIRLKSQLALLQQLT